MSSSSTTSTFSKQFNSTFLHESPQSFLSTWFGAWPAKSPEPVARSLKVILRSDVNLRDWQEQLKTNPFLNKKLPLRLIREPIPHSIRGKVYITMLPNHQYVTERLFAICRRRARGIVEKRIEGFGQEGMVKSIVGDLAEVFSLGR